MAHPTYRYTGIAKLLHWLIALLMIMMLVFGQTFEGKTGDALAFSLTGHSSIGLVLIALVLMRILWRIGHPPPALPETVSPLQKLAAGVSHGTLYALMIALPATGLMAAAAHEVPVTPFGAFDLREVLSSAGSDDFAMRRTVHAAGTKLFAGLLAIHIAAALFHQFVQKDGVLMRMLPGRGRS